MADRYHQFLYDRILALEERHRNLERRFIRLQHRAEQILLGEAFILQMENDLRTRASLIEQMEADVARQSRERADERDADCDSSEGAAISGDGTLTETAMRDIAERDTLSRSSQADLSDDASSDESISNDLTPAYERGSASNGHVCVV